MVSIGGKVEVGLVGSGQPLDIQCPAFRFQKIAIINMKYCQPELIHFLEKWKKWSWQLIGHPNAVVGVLANESSLEKSFKNISRDGEAVGRDANRGKPAKYGGPL